MRVTTAWIAALALAAGCAGPARTAEAPAHAPDMHAAGAHAPGAAAAGAPGETHACTPPEVAPDALSHTPHTPGRPEIRYYVVADV